MRKNTFRHTTKAKLERKSGYDFAGQEKYSFLPKPVRFSVIHFKIGVQTGSIRADRSDAKARLEEPSSKIRFLVHPADDIKPGDRIVVNGHTLRVVSVFPRNDLNGKLHHNEVDLEVWPKS